jgi:hypothetical protein
MGQIENRCTQAEFRVGWPRFTKGADGVPLMFEIQLAQRGEIAGGTVIRATVDDSTQYRAEGRRWRAETAVHMVRVGTLLDASMVTGWKEVRCAQ